MQSLKDRTYAIEEAFLSPFACKSRDEHVRERKESPCEMRTEFQRDRDRIIYCKAFRRLKNKTQVFFSPEGDHYVTRLTHTLDVAQIARSISRALSLNEDLTEAIALGHDLGHTPFGHSGERILNKLNPQGFMHNVQSVRVVEVLEKDGNGLNLTREVRDGILNHKKSGNPATLEGKCVSIADRIAYINHDLDDAVRAGILKYSDVPKEIRNVLGNSSRERINTAISSVYRHSAGKNCVEMEEEVERASEALRSFMFERVYLSENSKKEEEKAERMLTAMYGYFINSPENLPLTFKNLIEKYGKERAVSDYLSSMTDRYAVYTFNNIFIPSGWTFIDEK
ncbi:MAG: deoxyguanosinetriphosphate triphosphohydrolase [Clostridia bacterium]|nr:deoxyguanosinetriphosphate triphosphohydrolase [Clostridia bacterium]MDE6356516.1 deoxyguanosinetriphosphate triphosphohydrolase [Clostridia bacterium]